MTQSRTSPARTSLARTSLARTAALVTATIATAALTGAALSGPAAAAPAGPADGDVLVVVDGSPLPELMAGVTGAADAVRAVPGVADVPCPWVVAADGDDGRAVTLAVRFVDGDLPAGSAAEVERLLRAVDAPSVRLQPGR